MIPWVSNLGSTQLEGCSGGFVWGDSSSCGYLAVHQGWTVDGGCTHLLLLLAWLLAWAPRSPHSLPSQPVQVVHVTTFQEHMTYTWWDFPGFLFITIKVKVSLNSASGKTNTCLLVEELWIDSMHVSLSKCREMVKNREAWCAAVPGVSKSQTQLSDWITTTATHREIESQACE